MKTRYWVLGLMIAGAIINGFLAGGNVDRALVAMPAWRHVGPVAWADFSRYADLGNGQILYPLMAVGGTMTSVLSAALFSGGWNVEIARLPPSGNSSGKPV